MRFAGRFKLFAVFLGLILFTACTNTAPIEDSKTPAAITLSIIPEYEGKIIGNKFSDLVQWSYSEYWTEKAEGQSKDYFSKNFPFVEKVQLMAATGGENRYMPGSYYDRDLFVNPNDRKVFDDYRFDPLVEACRNIVKQGLKPYIVTGNVPVKYSSNPIIGNYNVNISPPDDYNIYYNYIKVLGDTMVKEFGINEVKTWFWGVLTEYDSSEWFYAGTAENTKTAYFKLYDYTSAALQASIGEKNLQIGAHGMVVSGSAWNALEFIDHCAGGTNYKTGKRGAPLDFLTISYYNDTADSFVPYIDLMRQRAVSKGLTGLKYGIDEGRTKDGPDSKPLASQMVAHSYEGSATARFFKKMVEHDVNWFSTWSFTTEAIWGGVPSVLTNVSKLGLMMAGDRQARLIKTGNPVGASDEVDGISGYNEQTNTIHVMAYNYNRLLDSTVNEPTSIIVNNIAPVKGKKVSVMQWKVDDDHSNFFPVWMADQTKQGLTDDSFYYSKYSLEVPQSLNKQSDINYWYSREKAYKKLAKLRPTSGKYSTQDNTLILKLEIAHHGVVFYEITNVKLAK